MVDDEIGDLHLVIVRIQRAIQRGQQASAAGSPRADWHSLASAGHFFWAGIRCMANICAAQANSTPAEVDRIRATWYCLCVPVGIAYACGQTATVLSLAYGNVSLTRMVKSLEPVANAVLSVIVLGECLHPFRYAALAAIVTGVAMCSAGNVAARAQR